jgi:hypothetical protein
MSRLSDDVIARLAPGAKIEAPRQHSISFADKDLKILTEKAFFDPPGSQVARLTKSV